jgi:PTS system glucose-specific IIA component
VSLAAHAPLSDSLAAPGTVPDPVFAPQLVGAGGAVEPPHGQGPVHVLPPVAGRIAKLHPHACVIQTSTGTGVLVHLGIDTAGLHGEGFLTHAAEGEQVEAGHTVITLSPDAAGAHRLSAMCPVGALDSPPGSTQPPAVTGPVRAGALMFRWAAS